MKPLAPHHGCIIQSLALWLMLAGLFAGCTLPLAPRATEPTGLYLIEWDGSANPLQPAASAPSLLISPVSAAAGYGSSAMLYVRQSHRLESFASHRWADAPARMIDPLLVRACEQSGLFSKVAGTGKGVRTALRLDSELLHLRQVFDGRQSRVELAMRFSLIDAERGRLIASRDLALTEPSTENTPYGGVQAGNRAMDRLLTQLQQFLAAQLPTSVR